MELYEYQIKNYLEDADVNVPQRYIITSADSVRQAAIDLTGLILLKPQTRDRTIATWVNTDYDDPSTAIQSIFDHPYFATMRSILVEKHHPFEHLLHVEFRTAMTVGKVALKVARYQDHNSTHSTEYINPFIGLRAYQARKLASNVELPEHYGAGFTRTLQQLFQFYVEHDAERMTISPLGITHQGIFTVQNVSMRIDASAMYRQKKFMMLQLLENPGTPTAIARKFDIALVGLNGTLSCIANGSGLSMAMLDTIEKQGFSTGAVYDIGSLATMDKLLKAVDIAVQHSQQIVISMFGHVIP
ncbi:MAG: hypothetical protein AAF787_20810, partial [Chloroflexota bacterium]